MSIDCVFEPEGVKPKTIKLAFVASLLSTQHEGERAKTGWLIIRILCPSWAAYLLLVYSIPSTSDGYILYLSADGCFSELAL
jgi:hypothetical protein